MLVSKGQLCYYRFHSNPWSRLGILFIIMQSIEANGPRLPSVEERAQAIYNDFRGDHTSRLAFRMEQVSAQPHLINELLEGIKPSIKKFFLKRAISVGNEIYAGHFRKNGVTEYACHAARTALLVKDRGGDAIEMAKAYLHDAVETLIEDGYKLNDAVDHLNNKLRFYPSSRRRVSPTVRVLTRYDHPDVHLDDPVYLPRITEEPDLLIKAADREDSGLGDIAQAHTEITRPLHPEETEQERQAKVMKSLRQVVKSRDKNISTLEEIGDRAPIAAKEGLMVAIGVASLMLEEFGSLLENANGNSSGPASMHA